MIPTSANVEYEAAIVSEDAMHLACKGQEPLDVVGLADVSVLLLEMKGVRRGGEGQVDASIGEAAQQVA